MRILSYKEFVETCRTVVESCTGHDTEGWIYDKGLNLVIEFGFDRISIRVWLQYDNKNGYWDPNIKVLVGLEYLKYGGGDNSREALDIIDRIRHTIFELANILSDCWVDYKPAYEAGNFKQYEWKLKEIGE